VHKNGHVAIVETRGNEHCHIILRGGKRPNYDAPSVESASATLSAAGLPQRLMIDCSHANSQKDYRRQAPVAQAVAEQIACGEQRITGVMIESHLRPGRQDLSEDKELVYGQSVTDGCLGWEESVPLLEALARAVQKRRSARRRA
jgi:3-deoxy-7-phosphoheptulonate synthase